MRRPLLSPSWLVRHALAIGLTVAFILLGRWQWHRAESGNGLSWAYTIEWPLFAAFVIFFWWKMMRFEIHPPPQQPPPQEIAEEPAEEQPVPQPEDFQDDPELAAYNRYLAELDQKLDQKHRKNGGR